MTHTIMYHCEMHAREGEGLYCPDCHAEQKSDELIRSVINDMPTVKATRVLMDAAARVVDVFTGDRVPMTRQQTLAVLELANATLHLETLLPPL
jgi:hypothetical protein